MSFKCDERLLTHVLKYYSSIQQILKAYHVQRSIKRTENTRCWRSPGEMDCSICCRKSEWHSIFRRELFKLKFKFFHVLYTCIHVHGPAILKWSLSLCSNCCDLFVRAENLEFSGFAFSKECKRNSSKILVLFSSKSLIGI